MYEKAALDIISSNNTDSLTRLYKSSFKEHRNRKTWLNIICMTILGLYVFDLQKISLCLK